MFLIPCRILFEGGPHDGFFADWEYIPEGRMVVPAGSDWRERVTEGYGKRPSGLAAIYVWRNTQLIGESGNPEILLRYRFLTYHAKAAVAANGRIRRLRLSPTFLWRRLKTWIGSSGEASPAPPRPQRHITPEVLDYSATRRDT